MKGKLAENRERYYSLRLRLYRSEENFYKNTMHYDDPIYIRTFPDRKRNDFIRLIEQRET